MFNMITNRKNAPDTQKWESDFLTFALFRS
jgi:hypothetical protein